MTEQMEIWDFWATTGHGAWEAECYLQMSWLDGVTEVREKAEAGAVVDGGLLAACNDTPSVSVYEEAKRPRHTVSL